MPRLHVRRAARRDLADIGVYTLSQWGKAQAEKYVLQLDARFHALARRPSQGRKCDHIRPGLMRYAEGRHVIYYRWSEDVVVIVRVLHDAMDPALHL